MSQVYNLFLVAYTDRIFVYEPTYPDQHLADAPLLILLPPRSSSATEGYIDAIYPHSINHLFLDFLGDLEIVLVACDDGDVIGYYVNDIQTAIERRKFQHGLNTMIGHEIRPFFMHNVGSSAWGLSVHSVARKVAISANTHQVTVITFGLTTGGIVTERYNAGARVSDHKLEIGSFNNNLPSITFCNTDDDPQGRLLVSGEITGLVYMHDLEKLPPTEIMREIIQVGFCRKRGVPGTQCECPNRNAYPHSIWCLSYIDRRAFRQIQGYAPDQKDEPHFQKHWNGSIMKLCIPDSSSTSFHD